MRRGQPSGRTTRRLERRRTCGPDPRQAADGRWTRWAGRTRSQTYRPFLSYNELGSMLDEGPSKLYDALSAILGLDALVDAQAVLQKARTSREKALKDAKAMRDQILAVARAARGRARPGRGRRSRREGLGPRPRRAGPGRLDRRRRARTGLLRQLRELTALPAPSAESLAQAAADLRKAAAQVKSASRHGRRPLARPRRRARPRAAASTSAHGDGDCPVCGRAGAMNATWHAEKAKQAKELRDAARDVDSAQRLAERCPAQAQRPTGAARRRPRQQRPRSVPRSPPRPPPSTPGRDGLPTDDAEQLAAPPREGGPAAAPPPSTPCARRPPPSCRSARTPGGRSPASSRSWVRRRPRGPPGQRRRPADQEGRGLAQGRTGEAMRNERFDAHRPAAPCRIWDAAPPPEQRHARQDHAREQRQAPPRRPARTGGRRGRRRARRDEPGRAALPSR